VDIEKGLPRLGIEGSISEKEEKQPREPTLSKPGLDGGRKSFYPGGKKRGPRLLFLPEKAAEAGRKGYGVDRDKKGKKAPR